MTHLAPLRFDRTQHITDNDSLTLALQLGFIPISSVLKLGAQRGLRECAKLRNESLRLDLPFIEGRLDPELPIFVNTTIPYGENLPRFPTLTPS